MTNERRAELMHERAELTREQAELTQEQERQLIECYVTLERLTEECAIPAVRAAARMSVAELRAALDGQAIETDFFPQPVSMIRGATEVMQPA